MTTPNLDLEELAEAQDQPDIPLNFDLRRLDALVQLTVISILSTLPASPSDGDRYIVGAAPTGDAAAYEGYIAYYAAGWNFVAPQSGWEAWVQAESLKYRYGSGSPLAWTAVADGSSSSSGIAIEGGGSPTPRVASATTLVIASATVTEIAPGVASLEFAPGSGIIVEGSGSPSPRVENVTRLVLEGGTPTLTAPGVATVTGLGAQYPTVQTDATQERIASVADAGYYTRFTNAGTKTWRFIQNPLFTVGMEFHGRNAGAGDLTIQGTDGLTINAPASGTLVVPENGTFTVKIVAAPAGSPTSQEADLIGVTVAA